MIALLLAVAVLALGCQRDPSPLAAGQLIERHQVTDRRAGPPPERLEGTMWAAAPAQPAGEPAGPASAPAPIDDEVLAQGKRLYDAFNCSGCHAGGGGAIGPALMDGEWIYGSSPENIFFTIVEGRPQGMPAFRGRIADGQVRSIVTYVRSLSGLPASDAPAPASPTVQKAEAGVERGRDVFLQGPCALCHTVRGTRALATIGPDLTHVGERTVIAGILPNTRGNMAGWILNPQNLKPGTQMPPTSLAPEELRALLDFLESLE